MVFTTDERADYEFRIEHSPAYASLIVNLKANQKIIVEAGAMAAMDQHIKLQSKLRGGLGRSLMRMVAGESLFLSEFTAQQRAGQLYISPGVPGDIQHYYLEPGRALFMQSAGFVACAPTVELQTKFQGLAKGFFSGESFFLVKAVGQGDIWFSSYGAIVEIPIEGGYIIDTGYIVAFEDTLDYRVEVLGGLSLRGLGVAIFGGEGLVCRFRGQGRAWIQSRELSNLINFLNPYRPKRND
ncbi:MAG: TIGR00266 family protein [Pseudanabaenaceae cyanobacterium SKYGB_i_bin29]|nr:TIGR00266 family protein [Pseudanabaenaceae cyanobacterium SKYG29]MDW8421082.1 TIGR00266 family protein [Pseudanabaenaceae cyanobacterium SKYGB_i_bin29]